MAVLLLTHCKKNKIGPQYIENQSTHNPTAHQVLILNEGNFMWGNGSVSLFNRDSGRVENHFFTQQNGIPLGDVPQSIYKYNDRFYIVINNSNRIWVCDTHLVVENEITCLGSPRHIAFYGSNMFITDLYAGTMLVYDLQENSEKYRITMPSNWSEYISIINDRVWVGSPSNGMIYIIDPHTYQITDSTELQVGLDNIIQTSDSQVWVLSSGDPDNDGEVFTLNAEAEDVSSLTLSPGQSGFKQLVLDRHLNRLYFCNSEGIYWINTSQPLSSQSIQLFAASEGRNFYSMFFDPVRRELYVSDAGDYVSKSTIYIFDEMGSEIMQFKAHIISGDFLLYQ